MSKTKMDKELRYNHHITNGGVSVTILDHGPDRDGVVLSLEASYFGYPAIKVELPIEHYLGGSWLRKVGQLFFSAADEMDSIDWTARYNK